MAVDLKKLQTVKVEKRIPILFMVDRSGEGNDVIEFSKLWKNNKHINSVEYAATLIESVLTKCLEDNIRYETVVMTYGTEFGFLYPKLADDENPYFQADENVNISEICDTISQLEKDYQSNLGTALHICKALMEDEDTLLSDRYKPVVIIISAKKPALGWETQLQNLLNEGRSSNAIYYWVSIGGVIEEQVEGIKVIHCEVDQGEYVALPLGVNDMFFRSNSILSNYFADEIEKYIQITRAEYDAQTKFAKEMKLNKQEYTLSSVLGKQFRLIQQSDYPKANKGEIDNLYFDHRTHKYNGEDLAKEIVDAFRYEPMIEPTKDITPEKPAVPSLSGDYGENDSAKGDGIV